jgi:hypothetical protein
MLDMKVAVPTLATLELSGQYVATVPDFEPGIQVLRMIRASGNLDQVLDAVSKRSDSLHHVNVSSCSLKDLSLAALCTVVAKPSIDCFEAANMRSATAKELQSLLESLNRRCRVLDLGGISCHGDVSFDFSVLSKFEALENLSLAHWSGLTDMALSHLPNAIVDLNLAGAEVRSFDFLRNMTGLVHLDLDGVRLTNDAQGSLISVVSEKKNLRIRINIANRLPNERAVSPEYTAQVPIESNITFY